MTERATPRFGTHACTWSPQHHRAARRGSTPTATFPIRPQGAALRRHTSYLDSPRTRGARGRIGGRSAAAGGKGVYRVYIEQPEAARAGRVGAAPYMQLDDPKLATISGLSGVVDVTIGPDFICALEGNGQVYCWGYNAGGAIVPGQPANETVAEPEPVPDLDDLLDIEAGNSHLCGWRRSGQVVCWGNNLFGQHGDGTTQNNLETSNVMTMP